MGLISRVSSRTQNLQKKTLKNVRKPRNPRLCRPKMLCQWQTHRCQGSPSIQLNVAEVDENGRMTGANVTYAICGNLRKMGESDDAINRLAGSHGIIKAGVFASTL